MNRIIGKKTKKMEKQRENLENERNRTENSNGTKKKKMKTKLTAMTHYSYELRHATVKTVLKCCRLLFCLRCDDGAAACVLRMCGVICVAYVVRCLPVYECTLLNVFSFFCRFDFIV